MSEPVILDGLTLDPELQFLLKLREQRGLPPITELPLLEMRERMRQESVLAAGEPEPVGSVSDFAVEGPGGDMAARLYVPESYVPESMDGLGPLLIFFHGGGFVFGDLESHDGVCRVLCRHAGVRVLAIDYRLAPENKFPAAVEDARAALRWAFAHAGELGADPARVAVGGDSAGGHLSAVVAQLVARDGGPAPALQVLLYPPVNRPGSYPSKELFADGFFLTRTEIDFFESAYAGEVPDDPADARRHPMVGDLTALAPALVVTAGFDPLRDEGEAYAAALSAAGTPVELGRYPSLIHGFANMIGFSRASREALVEIAEWVGAVLRGTGSEALGATERSVAPAPGAPAGPAVASAMCVGE